MFYFPRRRFLILEERRRKLQSDIESLEEGLAAVRRRIEVRDGALRRINAQVRCPGSKGSSIQVQAGG